MYSMESREYSAFQDPMSSSPSHGNSLLVPSRKHQSHSSRRDFFMTMDFGQPYYTVNLLPKRSMLYMKHSR